MYELMADLTRAILYSILLCLFSKQRIKELFGIKAIGGVLVITLVQIITNIPESKWLKSLLPIIIIAILVVWGISMHKTEKDWKIIAVAVMETYSIAFIINFVFGVICGVAFHLLNPNTLLSNKLLVISFMRIMIAFLILVKYSWFQDQVGKAGMYILIILGSFILFFQQLFQISIGQENYDFAVIITILLYFTMIFTAFMLLQHNRLTAKQQAIEEDNRQMSQRLHRSKDVLGVVSQVVASEDHIDPKLRKELADFCDDEMNEMQDRALGANLIGDTGIELVNVMLQKQMLRCADLNISFDVMIPAPIDGYIREIGISATEFMRMLNDLLKNAVKAILSSDNTHRELLLIMGEAGNDCFEIRLYDSGVPFPPKILEHLGERGNTTDGTGNGIADTVETLRHYRASFVIEPIEPGTDIYTKCIHIAFDGQGCLPQNGEQ